MKIRSPGAHASLRAVCASKLISLDFTHLNFNRFFALRTQHAGMRALPAKRLFYQFLFSALKVFSFSAKFWRHNFMNTSAIGET